MRASTALLLFCMGAPGDGASALEQFPDSASLPQRSYCQSHGSFVQTREIKGFPMPLESEGVFFNHCEYGAIWSTQQPVLETMVIASTGRSYLIDARGKRPLKGYAGQQMSRLIHSLINGDLEQLAQDFSISAAKGDAEGQWILLPRSKRLQRALQRIDFALEEQAGLSAQMRVRIRVIDKDGLQTEVALTDEASEPQDADACTRHLPAPELACALLMPEPNVVDSR